MNLMGYSDRITAAPGETVSFKVSSAPGPYEVELVRLHGVDTADGRNHAVRRTSIPSPINGTHHGAPQELRTGSFAEIPVFDAPAIGSFTLDVWIQATKLDAGRQAIVHLVADSGSVSLLLHNGRLALELDHEGHTERLDIDTPVPESKQWIRVIGGVDIDRRHASLGFWAEGEWTSLRQHANSDQPVLFESLTDVRAVRVAAGGSDDPKEFFNGRIENPAIVLAAPESDTWSGSRQPNRPGPSDCLAAWDFSIDIPSRHVTDVSPSGWHGTLINRPTRAVIGHSWREGGPLRYIDAPQLWSAIHFHDDDLDDAQWSTSFTLEIPYDMVSGIYAARLTQGSEEHFLSFYVHPQQNSTARVLFLAPTNTYLAYANEHLGEGERGEAHQKSMLEPIRLNDADRYVHSHPEVGLSIYDRHSDDSGVVYSSRLRPILNSQPDQITWLNAGRRHFAADFYITGWLEHCGVDFDVATDEDLDRDGMDLLGRYDVVVTGSHPEYPTNREYDALHEFVKSGGRAMNLGGNGFYWVTTFDGECRTTLEVRRGFAAQRNWTSHPAELLHSSTGHTGGTHLHTGRNGRTLWGVTSASAGWGKGAAYERTTDSYSADLAFAFHGIEEAVIGDFGFILGGAAGDELESADYRNGTPPHARVLLTTQPCGEQYYPFIETVMAVESNQNGPQNPSVRADVVLIEDEGDGGVFSVGSISWAGSLAWNDYDNSVATLTTNVLRHFMRDRNVT